MLSKKWILRTLALLVIAGIGTAAVLRYRHQQREAASALVKKAKKDKKEQVKKSPDAEVTDEPAPAAKKVPKATVLSPAAKAHLAEKSFIAALRDVFLWRSSQPENPEMSRVLLEKLSTIACEDLPPDIRSAWQSLLQTWKVDPGSAVDPQLKARGERAAETLNAMFKSHGDGDIVL